MALIELSEDWDARATTFRPEWRRGTWVQERGHVRSYIAQTDNPLDSGMDVYLAALVWGGPGGPLPAVFSAHPDDPLSVMTHPEMIQNPDDPTWWRIRLNYSHVVLPTQELADIEWGAQSVERVLEGAQAFVMPDGTELLPTQEPYPGLSATDLYPITNSALDPFDPPPTDPEYFRTLTVTKNFNIPECTGTGSGTGGVSPSGGFDPQVIDALYSRRINSVPFAVPGVCDPFPARTVFLAEPPKARRQFRIIEYYAVTFTFWIRARGWNLRIADLGFRKFADPDLGPLSGEENVPIFRGGQPAQNAAKLNGFGDEAGIGDPVVYLEYRIRGLCDFADLGLFSGFPGF